MKKIYIDENLPKQLAIGLNKIDNFKEVFVLSIELEFYKGCPDEEWIPHLGGENAAVITSDKQITKRKDQFELMKKSGLGIFIIDNKGKYWDKVVWIIKSWEEIRNKAMKTKGPYIFKIGKNGKLRKLPL